MEKDFLKRRREHTWIRISSNEAGSIYGKGFPQTKQGAYGRQLPGPITLQKVVISYQSLKSHNSLNFKDRD